MCRVPGEAGAPGTALPPSRLSQKRRRPNTRSRLTTADADAAQPLLGNRTQVTGLQTKCCPSEMAVPTFSVQERAVVFPPPAWHCLAQADRPRPGETPAGLSPTRTSEEPRRFQREVAHMQMKTRVYQAALDQERSRRVARGRRLTATRMQLTGVGDVSPHPQKVLSSWPTLKSH